MGAPLEPAKKLSAYEIVAPLGAGGMGEAYQAQDTRLDRTVAIKVLPSYFSDDPERHQRYDPGPELDRHSRAVSTPNSTPHFS